MSIRLSRLEQETIITFNAAEDTANIYSCDPVWVRKIKNMKGSRQYGIGYEVDVPKKLICVRKEIKLSPEQKAKLSARMKKMNAKPEKSGQKKGKTQK